MFPYEELLLENGLADKPILLSYRSQQMLLMALTKMENRYGWLEMDDATWDELEDYIAQCETEILTESEPVTYNPILLIATREVATQTLLAANSPNEIVWDTGYFDGSNPTRIVAPDLAIYSVSFNFRVTTTVATAWTITLVKNGSTEIARITHPSSTSIAASLSININLAENDYLEVSIAHTTNSTLQIASPMCYFSMIRFMQ